MFFVSRLHGVNISKAILFGRNVRVITRAISTSNKKSETATEAPTLPTDIVLKPAAKKKRQWQTLGWDLVDERADLYQAHFMSFWVWSFFVCGLFFWGFYVPDINEVEWAQREAYIELRRREVLGLPLINPDYVDPETIILPPDELLGDDDIVI